MRILENQQPFHSAIGACDGMDAALAQRTQQAGPAAVVIFALAVCIWENQTRTRLARNTARVILSEAKDLTDLLAIAQLRCVPLHHL